MIYWFFLTFLKMISLTSADLQSRVLINFLYSQCHNSGSIFAQTVFDGFQNLNQNTNNVNSFSVSGWFMFRSYDPIIISPFFLLIYGYGFSAEYYYDLGNQAIHLQAGGSDYPLFSPLISGNVWIYFRTDLVRSPSMIKYYIASGNQMAFKQISYVYQQGIQINFISVRFYNMISCTMYKDIIAFWNLNLTSDPINDIMNNVSNGNTYLFQYFDFFYTLNNPGKLLNSLGSNQSYINLSHQRSDSQRIQPTETINTDFINLYENNGITLTFEAKVDPACLLSGKICIIISIINTFVNPLVVTSTGSDSINFFSNSISGIDLSRWNSYIILIKNQFAPECILYIRGYATPISVLLTSKIHVSQFQFGEQNSDYYLLVNHIRIYKGNYISTASNCDKNPAFSTTQCLFCSSGYLLDYQNSLTCISSSFPSVSSHYIDGVRDKSPFQAACPENMIFNPYNTSQCICQNGYYFYNGDCLTCPRYCSGGCTQNGNCLKQDPNRQTNNNNQCNNFDDGYSCISSYFQILSLNNFVFFFDQPSIGPTCRSLEYPDKSKYRISQPALKGSIFIGLSMKVDWTSLLAGTTQQILTVYFPYFLRNLMTIQLTFFNPYKIKVELLVNWVTSNYLYVKYDEYFWVGFYLNTETIIFVIYSYSQTQYTQIASSYIPAVFTSSFDIILGSQVYPQNQNGCISLSPLPLQVVNNMFVDKNYGASNLPSLMKTDKQLIAKFQYDLSSSTSFQSSDIPSSLVQLNFSNGLQYDLRNGFGFSETTNAEIQNLSNTNGFLTFITNIVITQISYTTSLFSYTINGKIFEALLIPNLTLKTVSLRICYNDYCKDSNYVQIYMNEVTFLVIIFRDMNVFTIVQSFPQTYIEFEIVTNYKRETLTFIQNHSYIISDATNIMIGKQSQSVGSYLFYLNYIQIYQGDGFFYFDYNTSVPCFLYLNLSQMKCIYLKQQYSYCFGSSYSKQYCLNKFKFWGYPNTVYEQQTQTYYGTFLNLSLCLTTVIKNQLVKCNSCVDSQLSVDYNCQKCNPGYFLKGTKCLPCDPICQKCIDKSSNCTVCADPSNQIPPKCNCISQSMYLDMSYMCQNCNTNVCDSCLMDPNFCLKCAVMRVNPPSCYCDPMLYSDVLGVCVQIMCNLSLCKSCVSSPNNCTECAVNRDTPPLCECSYGMVEQPDGTCASCTNATYYDSQRKICLPCSSNCLQCFSSNLCNICNYGFILINGICSCTQSQIPVYLPDGSQACLNPMQCSLKVTLENTYYKLQFVFTDNIYPINFNKDPLSQILNIYLPMLTADLYTVSDPVLTNNILTVKLSFTQNINGQSGTVYFLQQSLMVNQGLNGVLDSTYFNTGMSFQIGPLMFQQQTLSSYQITNSINQVSSFKDTSKSLLASFQSVQFIFYILNTLQPTAIFLLLKLNYPPSLYCFYQLIGSFIFPFVPDYQTSDMKVSFKILGHQLTNKDIENIQIQPYKKLGFSTSLLVNIPIVIIKYLVFWFISFLLKVFQRLHLFPSRQQLIYVMRGFIVDRLNSEDEVNLLTMVISIYMQFYSAQEQDSWYFRAGYYLSIFASLHILHSIFTTYENVNSIDEKEKQDHSKLFVDRIQESKRTSYYKRNYFFFQILKKYVIVTSVFFLYNFPIYTCSFCGIILFLSGLLTIYCQPYLTFRNRLLKIIGEFTLSLVWFIHIFFAVAEKKLSESSVIDDHLLQIYQVIGLITIFILVIYNVLYIIEFGVSLTLTLRISFRELKEAMAQKKQKPKPMLIEEVYIKDYAQYFQQSTQSQISLPTYYYQKQINFTKYCNEN